MGTIRLIYFAKETMELLEEAMSKININKLITGTVDFGSRRNSKTGEEEFYYKALAKI